jgi:hypothetical protein
MLRAASVSTATAAAEADGGWSTVARKRMPEWGVPTARNASLPSLPARAPVRTASSGAPPPRLAGAWGAARPARAGAAIATRPDVGSMTEFPALAAGAGAGAGAGAAASLRLPSTGWAAKAAVLPIVAAEPTAIPAAALPQRTYAMGGLRAPSSRLTHIGTRCFDDGPEDYNGPEENDYADGYGADDLDEGRTGTPVVAGEPQEGTEEGADEHNADLARVRRAGDHTDW